MSIRNNHTWMIAGVIFLAALFFLLRGSYFVESNQTSLSERISGSSLNGYWFLTDDGGCFQGKDMILIKNNNVFIMVDGKIAMLPQDIVKKDGGYVFIATKKLGVKVHTYIEDRGFELYERQTQVIFNNEVKREFINNKSYLKTCDSPTPFGYLKSLFYPIFVEPTSDPILPTYPLSVE
jgi:hypothetical protein